MTSFAKESPQVSYDPLKLGFQVDLIIEGQSTKGMPSTLCTFFLKSFFLYNLGLIVLLVSFSFSFSINITKKYVSKWKFILEVRLIIKVNFGSNKLL